MLQALQNVMLDRTNGCSPSITSEALEAPAGNASPRQLFALFKHLLEASEAKANGYDELHDMVQTEQRSVGQLERALQLQQRHADRFTAHDLLMSQLTQQLNVQSQAAEQLRNNCHQRKQQLDSCQADAAALQQEVGQKRKRIDSLMEHGVFQEKRIKTLEKKLQQFKNLCSYVATESEVRHSQPVPCCIDRLLVVTTHALLVPGCATAHNLCLSVPWPLINRLFAASDKFLRCPVLS